MIMRFSYRMHSKFRSAITSKRTLITLATFVCNNLQNSDHTNIRILVSVLCESLEICQQRIDKAIGATDKIRRQKYLLRYRA